MKIHVRDLPSYDDLLKQSSFSNSLRVEVRSTVMALREIDTIGKGENTKISDTPLAQTFSADVFVELVWKHPEFKNKEIPDLNIDKCGRFTFLNMLELKSEETWHVKIDSETVSTRRRVRATFEEPFELYDV
jgi:hypothetical protein